MSNSKTVICNLLESNKPEKIKIKKLKDLLKKGCDPNEKRISPNEKLEKESCLNSAINCNSLKCIEILLDNGSDPDCYEDEIFPLLNVFQTGDKTTFQDKYNMAELLLNKGANPNRSKKRTIENSEIVVSVSILSYCIFSYEKDCRLVNLMLKYGAKNIDIDCKKNELGYSILKTWPDNSVPFKKELSISDKLKRPFDHAIVYGDKDFIIKRSKINEDPKINKEVLNFFKPTSEVIEIVNKLSQPLNFSNIKYTNRKVKEVVFTLMLISKRLSEEGKFYLPYPVIANIIKYINRDWYSNVIF